MSHIRKSYAGKHHVTRNEVENGEITVRDIRGLVYRKITAWKWCAVGPNCMAYSGKDYPTAKKAYEAMIAHAPHSGVPLSIPYL